MYNLPQIRQDEAEKLANEINAKSDNPREVKKRYAGTSTATQYFQELFQPSPKHVIDHLISTVEKLANQYEWPKPFSGDGKASNFDADLSKILHQDLLPPEKEKFTEYCASQDGFWNFMSCVLLPHITCWRWPELSSSAVRDRYIGRISPRHMFKRLWWRAHVFLDPDNPDDIYHLLQLKENRLFQIQERSELFCQRTLALSLAREIKSDMDKGVSIEPAAVPKSVRRSLGHIFPESLDTIGMKEHINRYIKI